MVTNYGVIKRRQSELKTDSSISFYEKTGDTVNPLLSLQGGLIISIPLSGGRGLISFRKDADISSP